MKDEWRREGGIYRPYQRLSAWMRNLLISSSMCANGFYFYRKP